MAVVRNLMVRAGADFSKLQQKMQAAQKNIEKFKQSIGKSLNGVNVALAGIGVGLTVGAAIQDAVKVEGAIQSLSITLANNADDFVNWAKSSAAAFGMSKTEALDFGRTYANLISGFSDNSAQALVRTQDLLKASAVVASLTGRSMTDVMDRIRSGMLGNTEAIEDLGINVNVAMIESTNAFKKFANGKSWQQLDFRIQSQIRYFAILEQASAKYGTEIADNTGSKIQMFTANLGNLRLALGEAFLPILNVVLPALTRLIQKLVLTMEFIAAFSRALFGGKKKEIKTIDNQAKAVQGVTGAIDGQTEAVKAGAKAQKGFLAGFDEINSIPDASEAGGGSESVAGAAAQTMDDTATAGLDEQIDEINKKAEDAVNRIKSVFSNLFPLEAIGGVFTSIGNGLQFLLENVLKPVGSFLSDVFIKAWDDVSVAVSWLLDNVLKPLGNWFSEFIEAIKPVAYVLRDVLGLAFRILISVVKMFWENVLKPLGIALVEIFKPAVQLVFDILKALWEKVIVPLASALGTTLLNNLKIVGEAFKFIWQFILKPLVTFLKDVLLSTFQTVFTTIKDVINGLKTTIIGVIEFLSGVFSGDWKKAWEGLKKIMEGVFDSLYAVVKLPLNLIIEGVNTLIKGLNKLNFDFPDWIPMIGGKKFNVNIPTIPKLAQGGIVSNPTLAMIGEAGPEMVVPLENTSFVDKLSSSLGSAVLAAMQVGNGQNMNNNRDVVIQIDGNTIARALNPYTSRESTRVGTSLITVV